MPSAADARSASQFARDESRCKFLPLLRPVSHSRLLEHQSRRTGTREYLAHCPSGATPIRSYKRKASTDFGTAWDSLYLLRVRGGQRKIDCGGFHVTQLRKQKKRSLLRDEPHCSSLSHRSGRGQRSSSVRDDEDVDASAFSVGDRNVCSAPAVLDVMFRLESAMLDHGWLNTHSCVNAVLTALANACLTSSWCSVRPAEPDFLRKARRRG